MKRPLVIVLAIVISACAIAWLTWRFTQHSHGGDPLVLHGNVDLRQVNLAFNNSERIAAVLVQEGDRVQKGEVVARLETIRLAAQAAENEALAEAERAVVERSHHGNRPEEIAQARANVESAQADAANTRLQYQRLVSASKSTSGRGVTQEDVDNAKSALDVAEAKRAVSQKAMELEVAGPRKEDVAQAEAQLRADEAHAAFVRQQLTDAQLVAPCDAVVRSRLMEPGEMASPQTPVFSLAIIDPKWVRAYVSETDLGWLHPGMGAQVSVDAFPDRQFPGWIGFISPQAEFTPKDVQTEELRTSLVYEVRVFVQDPSDDLRLGMPATVYLSRAEGGKHSPSVSPATTQPQDGSAR